MIIILGLPRSGTTLLGGILSKVNFVHFESEPNPVWRFRNYSLLGHDQFGPELATEPVRRYIRRWFETRQRRSGARIIVEKTPANVLRIDFIRKIFPEARIIFLRRQITAVQGSMVKRVAQKQDSNIARLDDARLFRGIRIKAGKIMQIHPLDLPAYAPQVLSDLSGGILFPSEQFWGPRPPNWRQLMTLPVKERVARQCEAMEMHFRNYLGPEDEHAIILNYEDLISDPDAALYRLEAWLKFPPGTFDRSMVVNEP